MADDKVILVDDNDRPEGEMEKLEAHQQGLLHRAFSIFIFNSKMELLLQKRAQAKYHSGGLWTNTCCSHPRPGEITNDAANRRLQEEMGLECRLIKAFSFIYKVNLDNNLKEHEFDHVFIGKTDDPPRLNEEEAEDWKYNSIEEITTEIKKEPENFTEWFKIALPRVEAYIEEHGFEKF